MTEQQKIELAEQYYNQGKYSEVLDICIELLGGDEMENPCKVHTLAAKGLLGCCVIIPDESEKKTLTNEVFRAYMTANSALEQLWVQREIADAIVKWTKPALQAVLGEFRRSPTKETVQKLYRGLNPVCYSMFYFEAIFLSMPMDNPHKATEDDRKQANEIYGPMAEAIPDGELISMVLEDGVKTVMSATLQILSDNNAGSATFMNTVIDSVWAKLYACWRLLDCAIPTENNKKGVHPKVLYSCLETKVRLMRCVLDAKVFPEGKSYSVFQEQNVRDRALKEFHEASDRLKEIYPDYEPYEAPAATPVDNFTSKTSSGGCYVATAVYGSYDCPEVWTLRRFRDNTLANTWYGRAFIRTYYAISPTLVKWFGHTTWFKNMWRGKLDKMVESLQKQGVESTPYQDKNW